MELTIVMPCLDEGATIGRCIERAQRLLADAGIDGEILVADNGSTDDSREIARRLGARVVDCPQRGYGAALQHGIQHAAGDFVLMGDSDDSYHFEEALPMIERLRQGYDLCMGTRLQGRIVPGAMPLANRWVGNPVLTAIGRLLFRVGISDFHCGMRAFRRQKVLDLDLVTTGMEWASEMVIKARLAGLRITEVPITLYRDGRPGGSHLNRWRDGWRHLRFMLLHSPTWLFIVPGIGMFAVGLIGEIVLARGMLRVGRIGLDIHTMLVMALLLLLGLQTTFAGIFAKLFAHRTGILPDERFARTIARLRLERLLLAALVIGAIGLAGLLGVVWHWYRIGFAALDSRETMRQLIPSITTIAVAVQGVFNAFMLSTLFLKTKRGMA